MTRNRAAGITMTVGLLAIAGGLTLPVHADGRQPGMAPPAAGPAHEVLKQDVGTWDAVIEATPAPGAQSMTSKGVETNTLGCGGKCLIVDFKGEFMPGQAFEGHGTTTYDVAKQKYVGSWTDSMSAGLQLSESTWDAATKTMTGWMEGPDMNGGVSKMKVMTEFKDADTRMFTMFGPPSGGQETAAMRITYKRRK
jgi:hypothetical protein